MTITKLPLYYPSIPSENQKLRTSMESKQIIPQLLKILKNGEQQVGIFQVEQLMLDPSLYGLKKHKEKEVYFDKKVYTKNSKLDQKIMDERIGLASNDRKPYTQEFQALLAKNDTICASYDESHKKTMDYFREKMLKELEITDPEEITKRTKTKNKTDRYRRFEVPAMEGNISFDGRNGLTTFFSLGNESKGFELLAVGGGGSSGQRQNFSVWTESIYDLLQTTDEPYIKSKIYLYNGFNQLELLATLTNDMLVDRNLGSNHTIDHKKNEKIRKRFIQEDSCTHLDNDLHRKAFQETIKKRLKGN